MAGGSSWKISALISAGYEFVLALFLLFRMMLALVVLELTKCLPASQTCSCSSHQHHNLFCSRRLAPSSSSRECNATRYKGTMRTPARLPPGLLSGRALSEDLSTSKQVGDHTSSSRKAGFLDKSRSASLSSVYKRRKRPPSFVDHALFGQECKGPVDGQKCKCIVSEIELYDDLIEVSSEYLKQKDRGHEEVILSLLKALQAERRNLRTLYEELEEERIAAETAAKETMGMILRLQEEKSALQIEADHYQRMAEEKSFYDEHAIQLLEETLSRKEKERLLLEEELSLLRERSYGDVSDVSESLEGALPSVSKVGKCLLLLPGIDEAPQQEEFESASSPQNHIDRLEESLGTVQLHGQPMKGSKSFTVCEQEIMEDSSGIVCTVEQPEKHQLLNDDDDDDAKSILVQLSALEKQLFALEPAQSLSQDQILTVEFWKLAGGHLSKARSENNNEDVPRHGVDPWRLEDDFSNPLDEEKVVNVDVSNVSDGPYDRSKVSAAEEILEFHKCQRSTSRKGVQWEACEEEKHLDVPSFVPASSSNTGMASTFKVICKPDVVDCLQVPSRSRFDENQWNLKSVTLEDIDTRLQALEHESTLLRHRSAPSGQDQMSMVLLRDVIQELQELVKVNNRSESASKEALSPLNADAHVKGI